MTPTEAAAAAEFGRPSARRTGRDPRWPYVPVLIHDEEHRTRQEQILRRAFATRDEAVACAQRVIDQRRVDLAEKLAKPHHRQMRALYGVTG